MPLIWQFDCLSYEVDFYSFYIGCVISTRCNTLSAGGSSAEELNQPCSSSLQETEKNDETDTEEDEEELLHVDKPSKPFKVTFDGIIARTN